MILSFDELIALIHNGVMSHVSPDMVNGSSINVSLAGHVLVEIPPTEDAGIITDWSKKQNFETRSLPYDMSPGEFVLARTKQVFNMPLDLSAEFKTRSSVARIGLEHLNACWFDPGWTDSTATLELKNMNRFHKVRLYEGMQIGQVIFHRHRPISEGVSYKVRGRYNNQVEPASVRARRIEVNTISSKFQEHNAAAPDSSRTEAFYAGAAAMLDMLFALDNHSPDAASSILDGLRVECNTFHALDPRAAPLSHVVAEGRA